MKFAEKLEFENGVGIGAFMNVAYASPGVKLTGREFCE